MPDSAIASQIPFSSRRDRNPAPSNIRQRMLDKEILERTYDVTSADDRLPPKQYPTLEGIKNILEPLAQTDPKAKAAKPEDFVDMRFIKELDESGFIDELYKRKH